MKNNNKNQNYTLSFEVAHARLLKTEWMRLCYVKCHDYLTLFVCREKDMGNGKNLLLRILNENGIYTKLL